MLRVEFQFPVNGIAATTFECCEAATSIEFDSVLPLAGDRSLVFLTVSTAEETEFGADGYDIDILHTQPAPVGTHSYYVVVACPIDAIPLVATLTAQVAVPHRITATPTNTTATISVRDWDHLKEVADAVEREYGSLELLGTTQIDQLRPPLAGEQIRHAIAGRLSTTQLELLETAYEMGHFNVPQDVTVAELANTLGVSPSTLSERLRRAERTLCEVVFGPP